MWDDLVDTVVELGFSVPYIVSSSPIDVDVDSFKERLGKKMQGTNLITLFLITISSLG